MILYERIEKDGYAWAEITLNRPDKANALNMPMLRQLDDAIAQVESDRDLRAVILRARGRFFCSGGDIEAWGALPPHEMARNWILPGIAILERLAALPQPVIAAITGHALGGGLELALAADLRIAVRPAKLGAPEVTLGMLPGWLGVRRLAETIGIARARHMMILGSPITASQALEWGLVTAVAEDEPDLQLQIDAWREKICASGPLAIAAVKGLFAQQLTDDRHAHASGVALLKATQDCAEGVRAFVEKRKPVYRNC